MELLIQAQPIILITAAVIAICIGSFINVVILRLPKILEAQYQKEAKEILHLDDSVSAHPTPEENIYRQSRCPHCHHSLKPWHNIPVISFLFLRGKCAFCRAQISWLYPGIELLSGALILITLWHFGVNLSAFALCLMCFFLISLAIIDLKHLMLPDKLTLPLLWSGLLVNCAFVFTSPIQAILGAALGYSLLWLVFWIFKLLTQKEGMGYGDFKLMAALGAWFGVESLLFLIFMSAVTGIIFALSMSIIKRRKHHLIPFGPSIAIAGFLYPWIGDTLTKGWFSLAITTLGS